MGEYNLDFHVRCRDCGNIFYTTVKAIADLGLCEECREKYGIDEEGDDVAVDEFALADLNREGEMLNGH